LKSEGAGNNVIAPGHGPVYRKNPQKIIDDYSRFALYAEGTGKNEVTILWAPCME